MEDFQVQAVISYEYLSKSFEVAFYVKVFPSQDKSENKSSPMLNDRVNPSNVVKEISHLKTFNASWYCVVRYLPRGVKTALDYRVHQYTILTSSWERYYCNPSADKTKLVSMLPIKARCQNSIASGTKKMAYALD